MGTSDYTDYDEALLAGSKQRNWLLVGLMISLALHGALCGYFYRTSFISTATPMEPIAQTPMFKVKSVDMQPLDKASADQSNPAAKPDPDKTDVQLPDEKKSFDQLLDDVHASVALPDDTRDVLPDKPQIDQSNSNSVMNEIERSTAQTLSQSPNATREQNLHDGLRHIGPAAARFDRDRSCHQHDDQASEHLHETSGRQRRAKSQPFARL